MGIYSRRIYLSPLLGFCLVFQLIFVSASAQESPYFDGLYMSASYGKQNLFSGAFLDNIDVLQRKHSSVYELSLGWRLLVNGDLFISINGRYGFTDGDLLRTDNMLTIDYDNSNQIALGAQFGRVFGQQQWLAYMYSYVTRREFDIHVEVPDFSFTQHDEQTLIRYGLGLEKRLATQWGAYVEVGKTHTDFGGKITNMGITNGTDLNIGLVYTF